jgi:methylaspartate mutase sigma subunit
MINVDPPRSGCPLAVVATTPDDSHSWNLVGVEFQLVERGFAVDNLGPCTPEALLAERIRHLRPDLVVLSSVNGHGGLSLLSVLETLDRYQLKRLAPIVAGGLLTTDPLALPDVAAALKYAGISAVFAGPNAWAAFDAHMATLPIGKARPGRSHNSAPRSIARPSQPSPRLLETTNV